MKKIKKKILMAVILPAMSASLMGAGEYDITFHPEQYTVRTFTLEGKTYTVRAYENIIYVANPVDTTYQKLNLYIPEAYFKGETIESYTNETAPLFFPNGIGGYAPAEPQTLTRKKGRGMPPRPGRLSAIQVALSKGYVVASPGARGRSTQNAAGDYIGKAPAALVDLKAAVRYLKLNDKLIPGDAEKIVSNGTSAGGALSSLLGATGDHPDYLPYLKELGAAETSDRIYAVSAYCPITNLNHADMAYEWQFNGVNTYQKMNFASFDYNVKRTETSENLTKEQIRISNELKVLFPPYLNSLMLTEPNDTPLTLDMEGNGSFKDWVLSFIMQSAQKALDAGADLSELKWLTIKNGKATAVNFDKYVRYLQRQKTPPAFDALDLSTPENQLFGTTSVNTRHFTPYSQEHSTVESSLAPKEIIAMMNPMDYLGKTESRTADFWRIRHGTKDKDTSLAIPVILATLLQNKGYVVDFGLAWDKPHSGDYDLEELFEWIRTVTMDSNK